MAGTREPGTLVTGLDRLRSHGGSARTVGLDEASIARFSDDPRLQQAVAEAVVLHGQWMEEFPEILELDEAAQIEAIQRGFVNFYRETSVNPYVSLAARGPWIVTSKGAVLHDSGGYGMLGFGHAPEPVLQAMARPHVMANIMTANYSQLRLARALRAEIGHTRPGGCPYKRLVCLNSGSEAVSLAARLSDINAKIVTDPGGRHAGREIKVLALRGGFHGRTDRPAQFSDSSMPKYEEHLATFRDRRSNLVTCEPNDVRELEAAFERADRDGWFFESMFLEPVMGEGNPGRAITREFYDAARDRTRRHGGLLIVDSIQAGLRAHGCMSVMDYPGFADAEEPDIETFSKALNAGQFPLSVLGLTERAAELYRSGVYGNTMTTNPRAMDVATVVLKLLTPELRRNIRERGRELVQRLQELAVELNGAIVGVQGTGLLLSCELDPAIKCYGQGSVEEHMRLHGIGVIHGGANSLRFTPHFEITSDELGLIVDATRRAIRALQ